MTIFKTLVECRECLAEYNAGLSRCPRCKESNPEMPKITEHGGPSYAEGQEPWDGTTSQRSTETHASGPQSAVTNPQAPAPTTGGRSKKDQTANSTANSTAGSGTETQSDDEGDEVIAPPANASKKVWVTFVREQGFEADGDNAEDYTKQDLIDWWLEE